MSVGARPDTGPLLVRPSLAAERQASERSAHGDDTLAAARQGAAWAVTALYREIHPRLLRYLRAREPRMADDLASEVWVCVASGLTGFEGSEEGFRAWVFTIARRRLIDARRHALRHPTEALEGCDTGVRAGPEDPQDVAVATLGAQAAVDRITSLLTPDQADVVLLRILGGLSVGQVADILGKERSAVRVLQHRALRRLAEHFPAEADG
jgi:RNA polymerase sigma-70 factor (ECF subfamily)